MSTYLVLWRTTRDDIPLAIFDDRDRAEKFAAVADETDAESAANKLGFDLCSAVNVAIVSFDKEGDPIGMKIVQDFLEEDLGRKSKAEPRKANK